MKPFHWDIVNLPKFKLMFNFVKTVLLKRGVDFNTIVSKQEKHIFGVGNSFKKSER